MAQDSVSSVDRRRSKKSNCPSAIFLVVSELLLGVINCGSPSWGSRVMDLLFAGKVIVEINNPISQRAIMCRLSECS